MLPFAATISPSAVSFTGTTGKNFVVSTAHVNNDAIREKLKEIQKAQQEGLLGIIELLVIELEKLADVPAFVASMSDGAVQVKDGVVYWNDEAIHNSLSKRILWGLSEGFDMKPYTALMTNIMENPSNQSVIELYDFLDDADMGITEDGHFLAYKRVRDNYFDIRTGTILNAPGQRPKMPRNKVDDNRRNLCSHGLHFCSLSYLPHFGSSGRSDRVVILKINPKHVVSIPVDYKNAKGRAEEYEVVGEYPQEELIDVLSAKSVWSRDDMRSTFSNYNEWDGKDDEDEDDDSYAYYEDFDEDEVEVEDCCPPALGVELEDVDSALQDDCSIHVKFNHDDINFTVIVDDQGDLGRVFVDCSAVVKAQVDQQYPPIAPNGSRMGWVGNEWLPVGPPEPPDMRDFIDAVDTTQTIRADVEARLDEGLNPENVNEIMDRMDNAIYHHQGEVRLMEKATLAADDMEAASRNSSEAKAHDSFIVGLTFDQLSNEMRVQFESGESYSYTVPALVFEDFLATEHRGTFFNQKVRDVYVGKKIDG